MRTERRAFIRGLPQGAVPSLTRKTFGDPKTQNLATKTAALAVCI
jgi:hypothetical protein